MKKYKVTKPFNGFAVGTIVTDDTLYIRRKIQEGGCLEEITEKKMIKEAGENKMVKNTGENKGGK
jgi:hypothetical protein